MNESTIQWIISGIVGIGLTLFGINSKRIGAQTQKNEDNLEKALKAIEASTQRLHDRVDSQWKFSQETRERIVRVETTEEHIKKALSRIEAKQDQIIFRQDNQSDNIRSCRSKHKD